MRTHGAPVCILPLSRFLARRRGMGPDGSDAGSRRCCSAYFPVLSEREKRNARMIRTLLPAILLVISIQPIHAAELCPFLDRVVASAGNAPPFATVRYLDAPGAQCGVAHEAGHKSRGKLVPLLQTWKTKEKMLEESWACVWTLPDMASKDSKVLELRTELRGIHEEYRAAIRHEDETSEERSRFDWSDDSRRANRARELDDAAEAEVKRLGILRRSAIQKLGIEERRVRIVERRRVYAEARKFVSSVSACIFNKKVRGSWHPFSNEVKFKHKIFEWGYWWTATKSLPNAKQVGIRVSAVGRQIGIEIWRRK